MTKRVDRPHMKTGRKPRPRPVVKAPPSPVFDDETIERFIRYSAEGYSLSACAHFLGVSRPTLYYWADVYPEFAEAFDRAAVARQAWWEERAKDVAQNGGTGGQSQLIQFALRNHGRTDFDRSAQDGLTITLDKLLNLAAAVQQPKLIDAQSNTSRPKPARKPLSHANLLEQQQKRPAT